MAKKTTSARKIEPSNSEAPKQPSVAKPAKKGVAKLATKVRKTITDVLTPKRASVKKAPSVPRDTHQPESKTKGEPRTKTAVKRAGNSMVMGGYTQDDVALRAYF